jgi:hypothetical protein
MNAGSAKHAGHVIETHTVVSASKVYMTPAVDVARPLHAAARPMTGSLGYAVLVPLVAAIIGALVGSFISWRALAWNTEREWKKRQAQARRALQVEMLMNAQRLRTGAIVQRHAADLQRTAADVQKNVAQLQKMGVDVSAHEAPEVARLLSVNVLAGRDFDAAFRGYFTEATEGAAWEDVKYVVDAYGVGEVLFDGTLLVDSVRDGEELYADNASNFCKAIRAMSQYEQLEVSFYEEVEKLEGWLASQQGRKPAAASNTP